MIIPRISAIEVASAARKHSDPPAQAIIDRIRHWSLLGAVALTEVENVDDVSLSELESVVQAIGGSVDLEIELCSERFLASGSPIADFETMALTLLNAGALAIICAPHDIQYLSSVPSDHLIILHVETEAERSAGDQVWLARPTAKQLADRELNRIDVLVDAPWLDKNPTLIADFFKQILISDRPDGLWATLIVDPLGLALGLAYSNYESLLDAITNRRGTYWSRSRNELWIKGATSNATQELLNIRIDCDRDCLRFQVTQDAPGFCHRQTHSCFGDERTIQSVIARLNDRILSSDEKSFTKKLVNDPVMLQTKLLEEAGELSAAQTPAHIAFEAADVLYFSLVKMLSAGVRLESVHQELARRMTRVVRRKNKLEPEV